MIGFVDLAKHSHHLMQLQVEVVLVYKYVAKNKKVKKRYFRFVVLVAIVVEGLAVAVGRKL